jgi:hypothetical protein
MKKQKFIITFVAALLGAYYAWWIFASGDWFYTHPGNASNRAAILTIREELRIGDGYQKALRTYWRFASKDLRLDSGSPQTWSVSMPSEFGAREWVLYLDFSDGKVSGIRVRTSDGPRPSLAPEDVGRCQPPGR